MGGGGERRAAADGDQFDKGGAFEGLTTFPGSSTAYSAGQFVSANSKTYYCTVSGTSGSTAPSHTSGSASNGTATFQYFGVNAIYKSFATIAT